MSLRILVVEDDPISSDVLVSLLSVRGHAVEVAEDGFRAACLVREASYDLIFVDYHLPEMDGYALARLLRTPGSDFRMIALTGDRAGLAARRGADTLFDQILAKPIEPEELFALTAEIAVAQPSVHLLDSFLAEPTFDRAMSASAMLWRTRGLSEAPAVATLPPPTAAETARLSCCFRLVPPEEADCFVLLGPAGLAELETARQTGRGHLLPVFAIDPESAADCEAFFAVGDGESWSLVASSLASYARRQAKLAPEWLGASSVDDRLLAFLYVGDRGLTLRRDPSGTTSVVDAGGFAQDLVVAAARRLATRGFLVATPERTVRDGVRELKVVLSALAVQRLTRSSAAASAGY